MKNIPHIAFHGADKATEFEFINLSELFKRIRKGLDHDPNTPHRVSFFALLIVTNGTGSHQIDLKNYDLVVGTVLKISKGQIHAFQEDAKYEGYLIIFTEAFVINYFSKSSINLISHLYNYHLHSPIAQQKSLNENLLEQLTLELKSENSYARKNIVAALLDHYMLRLERESQETKREHTKTSLGTFMKFKNLVEENYTTTRNVKDYADMLLCSTKQLNQVVKNQTLNTAKTFIDNYVILEIKRTVVTTENSFKEIAFETGFDEVTNFTKFFKKNVGLTPKEFRSLH